MGNLSIIRRFVVLLLVQVLVCKQIILFTDDFTYGTILVYPLFIMLLPLRMSKSLLILLAFFMGIMVDIFYDSPGVHASASVFTAFIRPVFLKILEPDGGYPIQAIPSKHYFGIVWFIQYAAYMLGTHILFYFTVEAFTFVFWKEILIKSMVTFSLTYIVLVVHQMLFNSKN